MDSSLISGLSAFHTLTPEKRILNIPLVLTLGSENASFEDSLVL